MAIALPVEGEDAPVVVDNPGGGGPFVLVCDHASNRMPPAFGGLGLSDADQVAHIAWDPGALGVSLELSRLLDAPLIHSTLSRLLVDCNRDQSAVDLIPEISEQTVIPGNQGLTPEERARRVALAHTPFHAAIDSVLDERQRLGQPTALVSVHTFTPVYKGAHRDCEIGLISDRDRRLADPALSLLKERSDWQVGDNDPYSPADGVYYTLTRHGENRGLVPLMIEIRNDRVKTPEAEKAWAQLLAGVLADALKNVPFENAGGLNA
ncbi:N-formylglutamate amidohydrolase [uncultured Roseibium sp.]|uniref:N-formylglutamate amidohydrolase n=1 Tax=uncultured Roseibium sp. TaxID=1936171 RepID=UPI003216FC56